MKLKKNTLALIGLFYTLSVLCQCNSTAGQKKTDTTQLTTIELHSYLAKLRFPEDLQDPDKRDRANKPVSHYDWGIQSELTERSNP